MPTWIWTNRRASSMPHEQYTDVVGRSRDYRPCAATWLALPPPFLCRFPCVWHVKKRDRI